MIVTLLGVRGSRPISNPNSLRYGGNTTCFKVEIHGMPPIYIDGGTGLFEEGVRLVSQDNPDKILMFITHTHWDHILSFPFFAPLYEETCEVVFHAPVSRNQSFEKLIQGQHNPMAFPVPFSNLKAKQSFVDARPGDEFVIDKLKASCLQLNHPGMTLGWRFEADERVMVVVTDNAPIESNYLGEGMAESAEPDSQTFEETFTRNLVEFLRDADLVVYDTHFDEVGIINKRHWGHSTPKLAIEHCMEAGVKRLLLHHHAPEDSDEAVEQKTADAWKIVKNTSLQVEPASEGMRIWL